MNSHGRVSLAHLKERTASSHLRAERTGFVADLLRRRASREGMALFTRNLLPIYDAMETAIEGLRDDPLVSNIYFPAIERRLALESDAAFLAGAQWRDLPVQPAAQTYVARIRDVAARAPELLIAHAYVRYLGDLNGGQILKRLIGETLGLPPEGLRFYEFSRIEDMPSFLATYRAAFERALAQVQDGEDLCAEAERAFGFNIDLSIETQAWAAKVCAA